MNNFNNFDNNNSYLVNHSLNKSNQLKQQELFEQQAMRKAYCKVNNIPYEEPEQLPGILQGSLKVILIVAFFFSSVFILSLMIGDPNFIKFLSLFF